jgi:hypothetical protein
MMRAFFVFASALAEVYESQAALDNHRNVVLPAFRKEHGPVPEGIFTRPPETELWRDISK